MTEPSPEHSSDHSSMVEHAARPNRGRVVIVSSAIALAVLVVVVLMHPSWLQAIPAAMTSGYYGLGLVHYLREMTGKGHDSGHEVAQGPVSGATTRWSSIWPLTMGILASLVLLGMGGGGHSSGSGEHTSGGEKAAAPVEPKRALYGFIVHGMEIETGTSINKILKALGPEDFIGELRGNKLYTWEMGSGATFEATCGSSGNLIEGRAYYNLKKVDPVLPDPEIYFTTEPTRRVVLGETTMASVQRDFAEPANRNTHTEEWGDGMSVFGWSTVFGREALTQQKLVLATFSQAGGVPDWQGDGGAKKVLFLSISDDRYVPGG